MSLATPLVALLVSCRREEPGKDGPTPPDPPSPLLDVPESLAYEVPGMSGEAHIVRTSAGIPYVFAEDDVDLARATGFVTARDRFFVMDMARRLTQGRLSEILGDAALPTDLESRGVGMSKVTDLVLGVVSEDPALAARFDAYVEGVNLYVTRAQAGELPLPGEIATLGPFLGAADPGTLLEPFERRDLAGVAAALVYNLGFETGDVGRADTWLALDTYATGLPEEALRRAGAREIFLRTVPTWPIPSIQPADLRSAPARPAPPGPLPRVERRALRRLSDRLQRLERRLGHDHENGFGSNAWAVDGAHTVDGRALLAGDGHLPLSIPALFYAIGLDDRHLGGGSTHQVGLVFPGFPTLAVGTNGDVAWSQTQLMGDITDWYAEALVLARGAPTATVVRGEERPLRAIDESYVIRSVPVLGSVGRTETWTRWETADGRLLVEVEGTPAEPGDDGAIAVEGAFVVPGDVDGDGVVTGISVDYTGYDPANLVRASDGFGHADGVDAFREATKGLVAYSQNIVAADKDGRIFYTGYQAVPCRGYLPRRADGTPEAGADPSLLLDGTRFGSFTIPVGADGKVDETDAADPERCVVPFDAYPMVADPAAGFVMTANNDPDGRSFDGSLWDDGHYLGGPWLEGYRADRITEVLAAQAAAGTASLDTMAALQGDHTSLVARHWLGDFLAALDGAEALAEDPGRDPVDQRVAALWTADADRLAEARERLGAWEARGLHAASGVDTFYAPLGPDDPDDSVATMIWAAWSGELVSSALDDEGFPGIFQPTGNTGRTRTITEMLGGRGAGNPRDLAHWSPDTRESVYWDVVGTAEIERSDELLVASLARALDTLTAPSDEPGIGGFGTPRMAEWRWGLRHQAKMESILNEFLSADDGFGFLIEPFSVTTDLLPLGSSLPEAQELRWFPRPGDHLGVDAGDPGFDRSDWTYGSGPVFRMVVALGPEGWEGRNVLPGGQSGVNTDPTFADQAALWLGNETLPMWRTPEEVAADGAERIVLRPPG